MPRTKLDKANEIEKKAMLEEGMARVMYNGKEILADALHAISVLSKQGGDVIDVNLSLDKAVVFCDNYEIPYSTPATKSALLEAIKKRF